jgi:hypothetical protein
MDEMNLHQDCDEVLGQTGSIITQDLRQQLLLAIREKMPRYYLDGKKDLPKTVQFKSMMLPRV